VWRSRTVAAQPKLNQHILLLASHGAAPLVGVMVVAKDVQGSMYGEKRPLALA
jgi:hypothetical protein